jgi:uncharacterized protein (DUF433 family)
MAEAKDEGRYYVEVLLPGFIEASSGMQFGVPCLIGTRIPHYVGQGWVWESLDAPRYEGLTREKIIALAAFDAGYEWHKSRKRREKMGEEVAKLWAKIALEKAAEPAPPEGE